MIWYCSRHCIDITPYFVCFRFPSHHHFAVCRFVYTLHGLHLCIYHLVTSPSGVSLTLYTSPRCFRSAYLVISFSFPCLNSCILICINRRITFCITYSLEQHFSVTITHGHLRLSIIILLYSCCRAKCCETCHEFIDKDRSKYRQSRGALMSRIYDYSSGIFPVSTVSSVLGPILSTKIFSASLSPVAGTSRRYTRGDTRMQASCMRRRRVDLASGFSGTLHMLCTRRVGRWYFSASS
jgi:hypothetical protein